MKKIISLILVLFCFTACPIWVTSVESTIDLQTREKIDQIVQQSVMRMYQKIMGQVIRDTLSHYQTQISSHIYLAQSRMV